MIGLKGTCTSKGKKNKLKDKTWLIIKFGLRFHHWFRNS
jgi:hypothetical protein